MKNSANLARSAEPLLKSSANPSVPPNRAVATPTRKPPNGGAKHTRDIGSEKYVGPNQGKKPTCHGRQSEAGCCKPNGKKQRWLGNSVPAAPKFVIKLHHGQHDRTTKSKIRPSIE